MHGKIIKIDALKESRAEKSFRRIYFLLEDGSWAKTDIVPVYRNYKNWKALISMFDLGNIIFVDGLEFRNKGEIDADCPVRYTDRKFEIIKTDEEKIIQET